MTSTLQIWSWKVPFDTSLLLLIANEPQGIFTSPINHSLHRKWWKKAMHFRLWNRMLYQQETHQQKRSELDFHCPTMQMDCPDRSLGRGVLLLLNQLKLKTPKWTHRWLLLLIWTKSLFDEALFKSAKHLRPPDRSERLTCFEAQNKQKMRFKEGLQHFETWMLLPVSYV